MIISTKKRNVPLLFLCRLALPYDKSKENVCLISTLLIVYPLSVPQLDAIPIEVSLYSLSI